MVHAMYHTYRIIEEHHVKSPHVDLSEDCERPMTHSELQEQGILSH